MIEPLYFGREPHRLFGVYHPGPLRVGVVLCYPIGQEYIRVHRAYLQLARRLAQRGFPVLRFDYYGCGDSTGDCDQGTPKQWIADISTAVDELRGSGVEQTALIGMRFGVMLALACGAERGDVAALVCWEPVVRGSEYLKELGRLHDAWLAGSFAKPKARHAPGVVREVLGFPLTESMETEYDNCDLRILAGKPAERVLIIDGGDTVGSDDLTEYLKTMEVDVSRISMTYPRLWAKGSEPESKGLVPVDVLQHVVAWMSEAFS